ncbi:hypothetical protein ACROYT_G015149 [Oculina patagonica]
MFFRTAISINDLAVIDWPAHLNCTLFPEPPQLCLKPPSSMPSSTTPMDAVEVYCGKEFAPGHLYVAMPRGYTAEYYACSLTKQISPSLIPGKTGFSNDRIYVSSTSMDEKNGLDIGAGQYRNDKKCKEFVSSMASVARERITDEVHNA